MRVTKANVTRVCAVCERTLLMGEHTLRFSPDGEDFVDVCPLCSEVALDHGANGDEAKASLQAKII